MYVRRGAKGKRADVASECLLFCTTIKQNVQCSLVIVLMETSGLISTEGFTVRWQN